MFLQFQFDNIYEVDTLIIYKTMEKTMKIKYLLLLPPLITSAYLQSTARGIPQKNTPAYAEKRANQPRYAVHLKGQGIKKHRTPAQEALRKERIKRYNSRPDVQKLKREYREKNASLIAKRRLLKRQEAAAERERLKQEKFNDPQYKKELIQKRQAAIVRKKQRDHASYVQNRDTILAKLHKTRQEARDKQAHEAERKNQLRKKTQSVPQQTDDDLARGAALLIALRSGPQKTL